MFENSPLTKEEVLEEFGEIGKRVRDQLEMLEQLKEHYVFEYTDLKLRDLSYELYKRVERGELPERRSYDQFNAFADTEREVFFDFLRDCDLVTEPLGRTSSFRILPLYAHRDIVKLFTENDPCAIEVMYDEVDASLVGSGLIEPLLKLSMHKETISIDQLAEALKGGYIPYHSSLEEMMSDIDEVIEEFSNTLDYFDEEIEGLDKVLKNVENAYGYIEGFKENQIEAYDNYYKGDE